MSKHLEILGDFVLVEEVKPPEQSKVGSLVIPMGGKNVKYKIGLVVSVGPGQATMTGERLAMTVKIGDRVLFGHDSGAWLAYEGKARLIIGEGDIFAIERETAEGGQVQ